MGLDGGVCVGAVRGLLWVDKMKEGGMEWEEKVRGDGEKWCADVGYKVGVMLPLWTSPFFLLFFSTDTSRYPEPANTKLF